MHGSTIAWTYFKYKMSENGNGAIMIKVEGTQMFKFQLHLKFDKHSFKISLRIALLGSIFRM